MRASQRPSLGARFSVKPISLLVDLYKTVRYLLRDVSVNVSISLCFISSKLNLSRDSQSAGRESKGMRHRQPFPNGTGGLIGIVLSA